jgi:hypothetical protein
VTIELLTTLGGTLAGYVMKLLAIRSQNQQDLLMTSLKIREASDQSADKAAARVSSKAGKFVRRFIVIAILFAVVFLPLLAPLWGLPVILENDVQGTSVLWGLITGPTTKIFTEINGVILIPELRQVLLAIVGFYFGTSSAKP